MPAPVVGIVGMKALRADIHRLTDDRSSELYKAIKAAGMEAAGPVASAIRHAIPAISGDLGGTVRVAPTRTGASIWMGSASAPYAGWVEFGGTIHATGSHRPFIAGGRYMFPAARGVGPVAAETYAAAIGRVFASDHVWTNVTNDGRQVHD
jgi:hypothetical protein